MKFSFTRLITRLLISLLCLLTITGSVRPNAVEQIRSQGERIVVTRNTVTHEVLKTELAAEVKGTGP